MQLEKKCQYCSKEIPYTACYCKKCGRDQISPNLAVEQYFKIQIARYGVILASLSIIIIGFIVSIGLWELTIGLLYLAGVIFSVFLTCWIPTLLILQLVPEIALSYKIPYLKQRIQVSKRAMWRNVVVYFSISAFILALQYQLAQKAPSLDQFNDFLSETPYRKSDLTFQIKVPIGSIHLIEKQGEKAAYIGLWNGFTPVNPGLINKDSKLFAKHFNLVINE